MVDLRAAGWLAIAAALLCLSGCDTVFFLNQTAERNGNITVSFINNTPYRASFSYGSYDKLDNSPGAVSFQQLRLEGDTTSAAQTLTCRRNVAIGTQDLVDRVLATRADENDNFDPDAFDIVVHFSGAAQDSDAAALPTRGSALGRERLLGADYSCGDQLVFTFEEDPNAEGGFRIDFTVIVDTRNQ